RIEVGGLDRAGHPDTYEAWLVIGEHHPVLHPGALGLALRATGSAAYAVAVDGNGAAKAGAPRESLPEGCPAGQSLPPAVPRKSHRTTGRARPVLRRAGPVRTSPNWRLLASRRSMHP